MREINIIIPTFNEKKNIQRLIENLKKEIPRAQITIVDDSLDDDIGNIIKKKNILRFFIIIEKIREAEVQLSYLV